MGGGHNYTSVADLEGACMGTKAASLENLWKLKKTFKFCCSYYS